MSANDGAASGFSFTDVRPCRQRPNRYANGSLRVSSLHLGRGVIRVEEEGTLDSSVLGGILLDWIGRVLVVSSMDLQCLFQQKGYLDSS